MLSGWMRKVRNRKQFGPSRVAQQSMRMITMGAVVKERMLTLVL